MIEQYTFSVCFKGFFHLWSDGCAYFTKTSSAYGITDQNQSYVATCTNEIKAKM